MYGLSKKKLDEKVKVTCYGKTEVITRRQGLKFYREGMECSEGSEHRRYEKIFFALLDGKMEASDD